MSITRRRFMIGAALSALASTAAGFMRKPSTPAGAMVGEYARGNQAFTVLHNPPTFTIEAAFQDANGVVTEYLMRGMRFVSYSSGEQDYGRATMENDEGQVLELFIEPKRYAELMAAGVGQEAELVVSPPVVNMRGRPE